MNSRARWRKPGRQMINIQSSRHQQQSDNGIPVWGYSPAPQECFRSLAHKKQLIPFLQRQERLARIPVSTRDTYVGRE